MTFSNKNLPSNRERYDDSIIIRKSNSRQACQSRHRDWDLSSHVWTKKYPKELSVKYIDCSVEDYSIKIQDIAEELGGVDLIVFRAGVGTLKNSPGYKVENNANKVSALGFTEVADWGCCFIERQR